MLKRVHTCRSRIVVSSFKLLLRILNYSNCKILKFEFSRIQILNFRGEGEGVNLEIHKKESEDESEYLPNVE
jgi:hypothetical protein